MSVTLGELLGSDNMTMRKPLPILNNLGQPVGHSEPPRSFRKLRKTDYTVSPLVMQPANMQNIQEDPSGSGNQYLPTTVHAEYPGEGVPYTMIDESPLMGPSQPGYPAHPEGALFGETMRSYGTHSPYIDDRMSYSAMGPYNSNRTIPDYNYIVGPSPAQRAINQAQMSSEVKIDARGNRYVVTSEGMKMYLPREFASVEASRAQQRNIQQYGEFNPYPEIAGGKPLLQNAIASDQSVAMGEPLPDRLISVPEKKGSESFDYSSRSGCASALQHVMSCPVCSKYFQCDNKLYILMMIMLVMIFSGLLYMAMKK